MENFLTSTPNHLLQSPAWGELKSRFGWTAHYIQVGQTTVQILFKPLPAGFTIAYIPKGPTVDWSNIGQCQAVFSTIHALAKKQRAIFLKVEPDEQDGQTETVSFLQKAGFCPADTIQPRTSVVINIEADEDEILANMKQKTRYNIRLSNRKGVTIREGTAADIGIFYSLSQTTAERDRFDIHSHGYYQTAYELFAPTNCTLFIAEFEEKPLAGLMVFRHKTDAYYLYGASSNKQRNLMAAYLVQWAAIKWAKKQGCTHYDLWGVPDADPATLEAEFRSRNDGLWGVYRFKRGFGGQIVRTVGAYDYVYNPLLYRLYKWRRGV